jgi:hypothetical protein
VWCDVRCVVLSCLVLCWCVVWNSGVKVVVMHLPHIPQQNSSQTDRLSVHSHECDCYCYCESESESEYDYYYRYCESESESESDGKCK